MTGNWLAGSGGRARRDERREEIVAGALRLFSERGALPVRVEDIAEAVGISRATFYKYFSERDEIRSGVVVFDSALYHNPVPDQPGGGTVNWSNPWKEHRFIDDIELREDGGTPPFLQTIKAALAVRVKEAMGSDRMLARGGIRGRLVITF